MDLTNQNHFFLFGFLLSITPVLLIAFLSAKPIKR